MIDPLIITALAVAGASAGTFILRDKFNRIIIEEACNKAAPSIEKFKEDNRYVISLRQESRALATLLYTTISDSRKMRDETIRSVKDIQLPDAEVPLAFQKLQEMMVHNKSIFVNTIKGTYRHKLRSLLKEQVKHRIHLLKEAAQNVTLYGVPAANTPEPEAVKDLYETVSQYIEPQLKELEQHIVHIMDDLGVIDVSVAMVHTVEKLIHDQLGEAVAQHLFEPVRWLDSIYDLPAATFALKSAYNEFKMLWKEETSFVESIANLSSAVTIRALLAKVGMAIDGVAGTFGLFTVAANFVATNIINYVIEEENKILRKELKILENEIEACLRRMLQTVNRAVREFEEEFAKRIEACPDINDEVSVNQFMEELKEVYSLGYEQAEHRLSVSTRKAIESLPENTWKQKLLFIDPRKAVAKLYLEAQRSITSYHSELVHQFTLAAETYVEKGVGFLLKDVVFDTPQTEIVLAKIEGVIETCAENYAESLSAWERETIAFRKKGSEDVAATIKSEREYYEEFVAAREPRMQELMKKIKANNKRQGKGPTK